MRVRARLHARARRRFARPLIAGDGIEIGALHLPFPLPRAARVRYVDRHPVERLREEYPALDDEPLAPVEVVDDAATLATFADGSLDFVVAAHVLQHLEDPVGALERMLAVLRPGGVLLLALPDRREGLDARREPPTVEHLLADRADGGAGSRAQHYREWAALVDLPLGYVEEPDVAAHAAALERGEHDIHFHCWTRAELEAQLPAFGLAATTAAARDNQHEFLLALVRR